MVGRACNTCSSNSVQSNIISPCGGPVPLGQKMEIVPATVPRLFKSFWHQSYNDFTTSSDGPLWQAHHLGLWDNGQVSFGTGPMHGMWYEVDNGAHLYITFHWQGCPARAREHHFVRIADTGTWLLYSPEFPNYAVLVERQQEDLGSVVD